MMRDIGVQLYSLREDSEKDFPGVLKFVAETGYKAVEPAGLYGLTPKEFKKMCDDLGLRIASSHGLGLGTVADVPRVVDMLGDLGLKVAVFSFRAPAFADLDAIKRTADLVNEIQAALARQGVTLVQHNHYFEFERIDGELKYDIYARLCPEVKFQLDTFWAGNFGAEDPAEMVRHFAARTVSLHLKDGFFESDRSKWKPVNGKIDRGLKLHPLGEGGMDVPAVVAAAPETVDTLIVELDYCVIDMREALRRSYRYLTENRLAAGNI
jgi:sugar phosphate isomerase/epimerase